jgi:sigma-B regulation protein RsbU (phosphoserine phosphatase)
MLDLARVQAQGTLPLERTELDLAVLVRSSVESAAAAYPDQSFELVDCDPCPGRFDRDRLLQMLSNLLTNAARHGGTGAPVRVRLKADGTSATIEVANANPGESPMPEYARAALFRPFLRSAEIADGSPGVGLGTFIVSEVARGHGGTVAVESLPAQTVFRVVLPLA